MANFDRAFHQRCNRKVCHYINSNKTLPITNKKFIKCFDAVPYKKRARFGRFYSDSTAYIIHKGEKRLIAIEVVNSNYPSKEKMANYKKKNIPVCVINVSCLAGKTEEYIDDVFSDFLRCGTVKWFNI